MMFADLWRDWILIEASCRAYKHKSTPCVGFVFQPTTIKIGINRCGHYLHVGIFDALTLDFALKYVLKYRKGYFYKSIINEYQEMLI